MCGTTRSTPACSARIAYLQANSTLPLRLVNVASPMVTASMIWDYTDLMMAMIQYPAEVHALLEVITEATIDYVRLQLAHIKNPRSMGHEPEVVPPGVGLRVSDDTAALLSPALYREFAGRYNARLSEEFGGIVVHSCGDCSRVVSAMLEIPGLRGLELTMPQNSQVGADPAGDRPRGALPAPQVLGLRIAGLRAGRLHPAACWTPSAAAGSSSSRPRPTFDEARALGEKLWPLLVG